MFLKREAKDPEDAGRGYSVISSSCLMAQITKHTPPITTEILHFLILKTVFAV